MYENGLRAPKNMAATRVLDDSHPRPCGGRFTLIRLRAISLHFSRPSLSCSPGSPPSRPLSESVYSQRALGPMTLFPVITAL